MIQRHPIIGCIVIRSGVVTIVWQLRTFNHPDDSDEISDGSLESFQWNGAETLYRTCRSLQSIQCIPLADCYSSETIRPFRGAIQSEIQLFRNEAFHEFFEENRND